MVVPGEDELNEELTPEESGMAPDGCGKKHTITGKKVGAFAKQQIKDAIFVGAATLALQVVWPANAIGIAMNAIVILAAKKGINVLGKKVFGKKYDIKKRKKVAKTTDIAQLCISAGALVLPVIIGGTPITLALAAGGAINIAVRSIILANRDKKSNKDVRDYNSKSRKAYKERRAAERASEVEEETDEEVAARAFR